MTTYNAIYPDGGFEKISLGEVLHRGGAAGRIFVNASNPKTVAKIFHDTKKSATNRAKLEAMLLNKPNFPPAVKDGVEYVQIAWPSAILEDDNGFCVGYLMPLINMDKAVSLDHLMQKAIRRKLGLSEKYAYRVFAAYNVVSMVAALHKCGHYIVDLKPSNISVYKDTMMVAMVDCDGFSIKGDLGNRYPAEFVSEEYIYPEGMNLSCEEMGEEQDKFALAVMIFKLLNNGIHPFSGVPRKAESKMLSIQERIEKYHYAYGLWPDNYQAPHPYSIHEYFDKKTLELFERAFAKGQNRPTAKEWQDHLWELLRTMKTCKKNPNHVYFSQKGCGLCISEQKFDENMKGIKKQKEAPSMLRGVEISKLSEKNVEAKKQRKIEKDSKRKNIAFGFIAVYMILFTMLFKILEQIREYLHEMGIGLQLIIAVFIASGIDKLIKHYQTKVDFLNNKILTNFLLAFALLCMTISLVFINEIPLGVFNLAK